VVLVVEQGYKVSEAARCLGIGDGLIRRWKRELGDEVSGARLGTDEREKLKRLRKENRLLRMEKEILKKSSQYFAKEEVKYRFIQEHAERWPVVHQCRLLGVQRNAYYDWEDRGPAKVNPPEELALQRRMKALFRVSRDSLGSRMLAKNFRKEGFTIVRDKALNLKVKQKRKYKVTTDSKHHLPVAENILNRQSWFWCTSNCADNSVTVLFSRMAARATFALKLAE